MSRIDRFSRAVRAAALVVAVGAGGFATPALADSGARSTVELAVTTLYDVHSGARWQAARFLLQRARAVLIAPRIFKARLFPGGEGGNAVLLVRGPRGWSNPAFYTVASAGFGLQAGARGADMVVFIMSDRVVNALVQGQVTLGAGAGISVVKVTMNLAVLPGRADVGVWASNYGSYTDVSLEGAVVVPAANADASYYFRPTSSADIVTGRVSSPSARKLIDVLNDLG